MLVWFPLVVALGAALGSDAAAGTAPPPTTPATDEEVLPCEVGQFACGPGPGGRCLPAAWRCDGRAHCDAGEDEIDCQWNTTCGAGQFRCARSGRCIAASWQCDGDEDCGPHDHSDEEPYMCEKDFECGAGEARCVTPVDGHFKCVPVYRYCDGARDCLDGSDEWDICDNFTTSSCASLRCSSVAGAGCRPTHRGLACYCPPGYSPAGDLCIDRDECTERETCSQRCVNSAGSFVCSCVEGYVLHGGDRRSCVAVNVPAGEPLSLVVVTQADIRRVYPPTPTSPAPPAPLTTNNTLQALNVRAIDYLYDNRSICYVHHNMSKSGIVCVDADDLSVRRYLPAPDLFPDIDSVSHLALDWVSGNWYFGDDREVIYVCNSNLDVCRIILDAELSKVRGMAVDPAAGLMFLCVWGATPASVSRASLAGADRAPVASVKLVYPAAVTLDLANREVYWTDSYLETVERAGYDGRDRRTVHRSYLTQKLQHIAVFEETLYLPVWAERAVLAVPTAPGAYPRGPRTELGARPVAALVFHRARQPAGPRAACRGGGGCSHLCVPEGGGGARCLCPHGMRLAGAHRCVPARLDPYLMVARGTPPLVQALPVTGESGQHAGWEPAAPATAAARPSALAVDQRGSRLYYCDVHRYEIVRQHLDGTGREVFIDEEVDNCEGIAVDWMGGNLYWTDSALGEVSACRLENATLRTVVARHEPGPAGGSPRAIVLDPAAGDMYWTVWPRVAVVGAPGGEGGGEGGGGRIETARMDGSRRRTLVPDGLRWPSGVALHAGALYWTDTFLDKIERLVLSSGRREVVTRASKPYGLAVYEGAVIWSEHATGEIRRLGPGGAGGEAVTLHRLPPPLYDLKLVSSGDVTGGNACSVERGGCAELCLATPGGRTCACGGGRRVGPAGRCAPADGGEGGAAARARCPPGQFHCGRGQCVDALYVCDGDADCPDASDEDASPTGPCANMTCGAERYLQCDVTRCVPRGWLCDGLADCVDGGDEAAGACGARACAPGQWACARSRRCVPAAWRCDGARDCGETDGSDEEGCGTPRARDCAPDEFRCGGGGSCVPWQYYCDGRADCADASDERGCGPPTDPEPPTTHTHANTLHGGGGTGAGTGAGAAPVTGAAAACPGHEMQCNSSECVPKEARCNDVPDCLDGSDEVGCPLDGTTTTTAAPPGATPRAATCHPPSLACDEGARCVPLAAQCDARADCADGADEAGRCGEPMCAVSACSHGCAPTPAGPACTCPPALRLQRDGTTCAARHACSDWGACSQRCVPHKHRVRCACDPGYLLADDGFTCKSTVGGTPLLVFSSRHEVRGVELGAAGGAGARALVSSLKNAVAVEWAAATAPGAPPRLYWTDVVDETIYSGELSLVAGGAVSDVRPVLEGGLAAAEGLAVDWVARNLYWVESSLRRIEVARLEGQHRRTLVSGGGMEAPRALAADPAAALLFWSDWEAGAPRVERCSLAGAGRRVVVRVDALAAGAWPNGVALDARARRLYWADARTDSVHTTTYEGEDHRVVLAGHEALAHPFALAVFESHIYWTDWRANAVVRANKWNGTEVVVVQRTLGQPFDLTVVHASRQPPPPPGTNPCADGGGCSHLCLLATNTSRTCACPHLMRLGPDSRTCAPHERALLVARPGEVLCVDVESGEWACGGAGGAMCAEPRHLAVVGDGAVAWADGAAGEVRRVALAGGRIVALGEGGALAAGPGGLLYRAVGEWLVAGDARGERAAWLRGPLPGLAALAVDARRGRLYWARETAALGARLEAADGDGTHLRVLRTDTDDPLLAGITGLVVDEEANRLYWVNTGSNSIQYMEVSSGDTRTVALGGGARPTALELDGGRLLWADGADGTLRACGVHPHVSCDAVLRRDTTAVLALRVYDARALTPAPPPGACVTRNPPCAHLCLEAGGRAACRCAAGYTIAADGAACRPTGPLLAYSLGWELRALPLPGAPVAPDEGGGSLAPRLGSAQATALAYSPAGEWVYWSDGEAGGVWRVRRDGTGRARVAAVPAVAGLALDHIAGTVYWGDGSRRVVEAARPDGGARLAVLDTSPAAPSALAVDARHGYLFVRAAPWLQHARLDGSDRRLVRQHDHISALALDTPTTRVYWVEGWEGQVMSAPYPAPGGGGGAEARAVAKLAHPVALAPHAGWLYWLDVGAAQGGVLAAPLDNLTAPATVLAGELGDGLLALSVWTTTEDTSTTTADNNNTCSPSSPCDGLCLYNGTHPRCVCPHGHLAPDLHTCTPYESFVLYSQVNEIDTLHLDDTRDTLNAPYPPIQDSELMRNAIAVAYSYEESTVFYSDITRGAIGAVRFDGTRHETLALGVGAVEGMVYSRAERALYWTSGAGVVRAEPAALRAAPAAERAALAAPAVRLGAGARPRGLDLDPCERRLYWADWGAAPGVRRAHAGRAPQTVVGTGVLMPNGLALDHAARWLYWADARLDRVERAHYDGSHRAVVAATGADHPFGVAAAGGRVYWTEWVTRAVYTASSTGGEVRRVATTQHRPMSIVAVLPDHQTCGSEPCAVLNGGCAELCVSDGGRHARCACGAGRRLAGDGRGCEPLARGGNLTCGTTGRYACAEGGCIPEQLTCDGVPHCSDDPNTASDENIYYCTSRVCPERYLRCGAGGRCVPAAGRCDGRVDCDDGSDERGCECGAGEVRCEDGACVGAGARCDGRVDCAGASDERGCGQATCAALGPTAVACAGGGCYLPAWRCDGARDCGGGEDEAECPAHEARRPPPSAAEPACGPAEFSCGGAPLECVPLAWVCDGRVDCATGADEAVGCGHGAGAGAGACGAGRWRCGARPVCVPAGARCDGRPDCPGAEDEAGCCEPPAIPCADTCLAPELYCDGDRDCEDGSDEPAGCGRNVTSAPAPGPGPCGGGGAVACSGLCVGGALVCDGRDHCEDGGGAGAGTDEDPLVCSSFASAVRGTGGGGAGGGRTRCAPGEWRCGNDACVSRDKLCDGHDDCGDYTDEWSCNVDECSTQNGGCAHNCTELRVGRACWCRPGWRRGDAGPGPGAARDSCRDVDECLEDAPCEHECRNTQGSFACSCHAGFVLMPDGVSCSADEEPQTAAALLLTNRYYIRRVPLEAGAGGVTSTLLAHNLTNAVALDYSWRDMCVYWSDVTRGGSALRRACPAGAPPVTLHAATTQNPDGLAVDWVAGNLYWGDKGTDTIEASRLDGRHRRVLVRSGLSEPRALALLPARGWLYWSDWGARPHIGRAGMDGSGPHARLARGLGWPNALTIAGGRLYFADAREDYIAEADLELREARVLLARSALPALRLHHAFAVAAWEGRLYWSDWETRAVESCRRTPLRHYTPTDPTGDGTTAAYECRTLLHTVHKPMDLRVFHPARQPPHPELTSSCERLQCEGLCLLAPGPEGQGARARCECPEHWVLQPDGRSCRHNCTAAHFVCRAALKCIPFWWRCDTADDCGDGADEAGACPPFRCRPGQFQCEDGRCLHPARVCDGTAQCARGEDERSCAEFSCLAGQYTCEAGPGAGGPRCVPAAARCDGHADCAGGEDEAGCSCGAGQVACATGGCVPGVWACDADRDCADGSDEGPQCAATVCSQQDEFRCHTGRCIPTDWRCDGDPDCPGREDEAGCESVAGAGGGGGACSPTYFRCPDGRCIPGRWRCDLEDDCGDGADEMQCSARPCSESEWRCEGGDCVPAAGRCDGDPHCADGSDEACAACAPGARRCAAVERCVRAEWWCDGEPDCPDGSDEAECGAAAERAACAGGLPCGAAGGCLPAAWRCDGRRDCPDGRDEAGCERVSCPARTHRCGDASCLPAHLACDGARDCADGSDEDPALCTRRSALGEEVCAPEEHLCPDGSCQLVHLECDSAYDRLCPHTACSQLCLPKHDNYTCKCVPGFKQRVLPDGMQTCEAPGERPQLLVAEGGVVRVWDLRKQEAAAGAGGGAGGGGGKPAVAALTGAMVDGVWWAWWGDEAGGLWRRRVGGDTPAELLAREGSAVRGVAVDVVSSRLYWTVAGAGAGGRGGRVRVGTLAARRAVTLYTRGDAEPDDLVYCNATRRLLWTDRGVAPALWTMGADGRGPSRLLWRRLRRPAALALHAPAQRVYLAEAGGEVVTVRAGGGGRGALPPPQRPCTRLAVWEEWVWCAMGRGVVRLPRRGAAVGPRRPLAAQGAVTALALLHPLGAGGAAGARDPCGGRACDASALCVRSASARGYSCLCPDGLEPADHSTDGNRTCVISRRLVAPAPRDHLPTRQDNGTPQEPDGTTAPAPTPAPPPPHTHDDHKPHHEAEGEGCGCVPGRGRCVRVAGGHDVCTCTGAWGGARCDHYVGHDHDCHARCLAPAVCVWAHRPDGGTALSAVYCACPLGSTCITPTAPPPADASPGVRAGASGGAWATTLPVLVAIAAALLALLYLLYRRTRSRHGRFGHARLADNVEISNPMYLAGEDDDLPPPHLPPLAPAPHLPPALHNNHSKRGVGVGGGVGGGRDGNHFANPVYDSMYSQVHDAPIEEHANLLSSEPRGEGSPPAPPERAALL